MLNAAIIGFGGIAQAVHVPGWKTLEERGKARLVAVYDIDPAKFTQKQVINIGSSGDIPDDIHMYTDLEEMLSKEKIDIIDICIPTFLHAQMAVDMLKRGYSVHSEKPMARTYEQCLTMIGAAKVTGKNLMIGQCLRFSSEYLFLKDSVENETFGKPLSAVFRRMSDPPIWSWNNWLMNHEYSGGCLMDLNIHDIDMVRFLFGEPDMVSCVTQDVYSIDDIAHSRFFYKNLAVLTIGDWSLHGVGFSHDYRVGFEKATIIYENGIVTVYPREDEKYVPVLDTESMYTRELEFFVDSIVNGEENTVNPPESAAATIKLIETLKKSSQMNGATIKFKQGGESK